MAISNLVSGGQSFERPNVSAFFGKSMAGANDNVEKVSSNFLSNDILKTIISAIDGIGKELSRIQDTSKNIMKSFDTLMKNTRDLNRDITRRFRDVNDQLNKSKIDFLRSIMMTPVPASDTPTTLGTLVEKAAQNTEETKKQEEKKDESKSLLDSILDAVDIAQTAKDAWDMTKKGGRSLGRFLRPAVTGVGGLITGIGVGGMALSEAATEMTKGEMGKQIYDMTADNPLAGAMAGDYALGAAVMHGPQRSEEDMAKEREQLKDAPWYTRLYGIGKEDYLKKQQDKSTFSLPPEVMRNWQLKFPEMIEAYKSMSDADKSKVSKLYAEGKNSDAERMVAMRAGIEAAPTEKKLADSGRNITGRNLAATIKGTENNDAKQFEGVADKASRGVEAATGEVLDEDQVKNKRIAGLAIKYGLTPSTVTATLEGGVPTSLTSNGVTVDVYNDLTPEEKEKVNTARKMRSEMRGDAKKNEAPQAPGANPPAGNAAGDNAGAGGPTGAASANAPAAAATAPPANNVAGASEGDQGAPEKAPAAPGGGAGGAGATGAESAPAGAPTPAPPAASSGSSEGGAAGGSTGAPEAAPAATPSPGGGAGAPAAEGMGTSGSPDGAPAAPSAAPTTPPPPPPTPEAPAGGGDPIVMNNSSTQSIGKAAAGETSVMSGQNLPMSAQNEKIQEYLARQTVNYQ
jgi:hypothetical protein